MAIFGPNEAEFSGGQGSPFQPTAPVADKATADLANTVGTFVSGGMQALGGQRQQRQQAAAEQAQQEQIDNATTGFQNRLLQLNRAVDQGAMTSAAARSRANVLLSEFSEAYPHISDDFRSVMKDVEGSSIMGDTMASGTEREQLISTMKQKAVAEGAVDLNSSEENQSMQLMEWFDTQRYREQLTIIREELSTAQAELNLDESQMDFARKRLQKQARDAASNYALHSGAQIRTQAQTIAREVETGELEAEEGQRLLDQLQATYEDTLRVEIGNDLDASYLNNLSGVTDRFIGNAREVLTGDRETTWLETQNRHSLAEASSVWYESDRMARVIAGSRLLQNNPELQRTMSIGLGEEVSSIIEGNAVPGRTYNPFSRHEQGEEGMQVYLQEFLGPGLRRAGRDMLSDEEVQELGVQIEGFIEGVSDYAGTTRSLLEFRPVVNMLASDDFGRYVEQQGGLPGEGTAQRVQQAINKNYTDEIVPMIRERFEEKMVKVSSIRELSDEAMLATGARHARSTSNVPATSIITPEFSGGSFRFRPETAMLSREQVREARALADELNETVTPLVNRMVKMGAHLEGSREYRRIYETMYSELFSDPFRQEEEDVTQSSGD